MSQPEMLPGSRAPRPVQILRALRDEPGMLERYQQRYGDAFMLRFERRPWHILAHPDAIEQVFKASPSVLHAGDANEILRTTLGKHSVLLADEQPHLRQRRLLLGQFHGEKLKVQRAVMEHVAAEQVEKLPRDRPFSLRPQMTAIALRVIVEAVLGVREPARQLQIGGPIERILDWLGRPTSLVLPSFLGPDHRVVKRVHRPYLAPVDRELYALIAERRRDPQLDEREDVLSMLLCARREDGSGMTDAELRDEIVSLIVAGHETTATALSWAFERLTRQPAQLAVLEAEAAAGDTTDYAEAIFREALRLRPVLMNVIRVVHEPVEVGGVLYPRGALLAPSIYLVQRRPEVYPDPAAFRPERWLGQAPGTYTWIPFGGGTRRCIGAHFAQAEMEVVLHAIARTVRLEPVGEDERPVPRFITSSPERGGEVRVAGPPRPAVAAPAGDLAVA